jgi:hypothetical protein
MLSTIRMSYNWKSYEPVLPRTEAECFMVNTLHDAINTMDPVQVRTALHDISPELLQQPIAHYSLNRCKFGTADCRYEIKPIELKSSINRYANEDLYAIPLVLIHFKDICNQISDSILYSYNSYGKKFKDLIPQMLESEEYIQSIADTNVIINMLLAAGASLENEVPIIDVIRELERYGPDDSCMSHEEDIYETSAPLEFCMNNMLYPIAIHLLNIKPNSGINNLNNFLASLHYTIDHDRSYEFMQHVHTNEMKILYSKFIRMYEMEKGIKLPECGLPKEVINDIYKGNENYCYNCNPPEYESPKDEASAA